VHLMSQPIKDGAGVASVCCWLIGASCYWAFNAFARKMYQRDIQQERVSRFLTLDGMEVADVNASGKSDESSDTDTDYGDALDIEHNEYYDEAALAEGNLREEALKETPQ